MATRAYKPFMNSEMYQAAYIVIGLFLLTIAGLIKYQSKPENVFGILLLALFSCGFVTNEQVVKSFANQGILTLVLLMVCSLALEKPGYCVWSLTLS